MIFFHRRFEGGYIHQGFNFQWDSYTLLQIFLRLDNKWWAMRIRHPRIWAGTKKPVYFQSDCIEEKEVTFK